MLLVIAKSNAHWVSVDANLTTISWIVLGQHTSSDSFHNSIVSKHQGIQGKMTQSGVMIITPDWYIGYTVTY